MIFTNENYTFDFDGRLDIETSTDTVDTYMKTNQLKL